MRQIFSAFKAFWFALRKKPKEPGQLREFVYLDETSVESLLASLDGEVLTGVTESRSKGYELGLSATGAALGVPAGVSPSATRSRSVTVEEQRKSVAQSAFARLRSRHLDHLRLEAESPARIEGRRTLNRSEDLDVSTLRRGDLVEVDAVLGASEVFRVKTVIDSMIGVAETFPDSIPASALSAIRQGAPISALLGSLSQGMIPIEGEVVGFRSVRHSGERWIVPTAVASAMEESGWSSEPLFIVGVTLSPLFWQDTRRILFSNYKYRLLGRLVHDGVKSSWSSIKLADVLKDVNSELSATFESLGPTFLKALQDGSGVNAADDKLDEAGVARLLAYGGSVAAAADLPWTPSLREKVFQIVSDSSGQPGVEDWATTQRLIDDAVFSMTCNRVIPTKLALIRGEYPRPAVNASVVSPTGGADATASGGQGANYVEVEIIAVYW